MMSVGDSSRRKTWRLTIDSGLFNQRLIRPSMKGPSIELSKLTSNRRVWSVLVEPGRPTKFTL